MTDQVPNRKSRASARFREYLAGVAHGYLAGDSGNFLALTALVVPVVALALGAAVDYSSAGRRQETLLGISDAAALAATQPTMMQQSCVTESSPSCQVVIAQVVKVFNAQAAKVQGITTNTITSANVTVTDTTSSPLSRSATVNWTSGSQNTFAGILGFQTIAISGQSTAKNASSPVTTFIMLIDESPSMYFPSNSDGVTTMVDATPANIGHPNASTGAPSGGCALGCHESSAAGSSFDNLYNPSNVTCPTGALSPFTAGDTYFGCVTNTGSSWASGGTTSPTILPVGQSSVTVGTGKSAVTTTCATISGANSKDTVTQEATLNSSTYNKYYGAEDNFALSRCLGVSLRIDLVNTALTDLLTPWSEPNGTPCTTAGIAQCTANENNTTFAFDLYTLDLGDNDTANTYTLASGVTTPTQLSAPTVGQAAVGLENIYNWGASTGYTAGTTPGSTGAPSGISATSIASSGMSYLSAAQAAFANVSPMESWGNGCTTSACSSGGDPDTPLDTDGLEWMYNNLPTPGKGTSTTGDTPEEVLFIVSDGLNDVASGAAYPTSSPCAAGTDPKQAADDTHGTYSYYNDYGRPLFCVGQLPSGGASYCTQIKNRGIRIAFLYLQYAPLDPDPDYLDNVEPWQYPNGENGTDNIEQGAIACASSGLEFTVSTKDDITAAMASLFQKAVQTAYLAH